MCLSKAPIASKKANLRYGILTLWNTQEELLIDPQWYNRARRMIGVPPSTKHAVLKTVPLRRCAPRPRHCGAWASVYCCEPRTAGSSSL